MMCIVAKTAFEVHWSTLYYQHTGYLFIYLFIYLLTKAKGHEGLLHRSIQITKLQYG